MDNERLHKLQIRAWTMYDWANSAFATSVMGAILPNYFGAYIATEGSLTLWGYTVAIGSLIAALRNGARSREFIRKAGLHSVSVYPKQFELLLGAGALEILDEELAVLRDETLYTKDTGLHIPQNGIAVFS